MLQPYMRIINFSIDYRIKSGMSIVEMTHIYLLTYCAIIKHAH